MTLGLKRAGFGVVGAVEIDPLAVETYRANHPEVAVWKKDIRAVPVSEVRRQLGLDLGELDLLAACPPCQGFSRMRRLNRTQAVADDRNDLILDVVRFVRCLRPKAVMFENVPGLEHDERFAKLCALLSELDYSYESCVIDAADYGVAQRRRRLLLLAVQGGSVTLGRRAQRRRTVRDAIVGLRPVGASGDVLHDLGEARSRRIRNLIAAIPKDGGSRLDLGRRRQLRCHRLCDGFKDVYGRMAWDDVAPTITGGCVNPSKGRFLHPEEHRAITLREAALLQSFPRAYHFSLTKGKFRAAELIGNALPPELVRRHALNLRRTILALEAAG
jgi:DNA (cytosine-5)-methyltransferase 1